jgi:hypothetical protein
LSQILDIGPEVLVQSWAGAGYGPLFSDMRKLGIFAKMRVTGGLGDRDACHALGLDAVGMVGIIKYSCILPDNPINDWLRQKHIERHPDPERPWAIPRLIQEVSPEETASPLFLG